MPSRPTKAVSANRNRAAAADVADRAGSGGFEADVDFLVATLGAAAEPAPPQATPAPPSTTPRARTGPAKAATSPDRAGAVGADCAVTHA